MNAFEDASRFLGVALILDKPQKRHHMNHLLYIDMRFSWKWYRFKHRRCPSPVRSIGSQMKVRVKFQSDKRSSLAILFLSGVKSASNCIKTCHRWIAKGLGDYRAALLLSGRVQSSSAKARRTILPSPGDQSSPSSS